MGLSNFVGNFEVKFEFAQPNVRGILRYPYLLDA